MSVLRSFRPRLRTVVPQVLAGCLVVYFAYHLVQGERGLMAWMSLKQQIDQAEKTLVAVHTRKQTFEGRVALMRPEHIDEDMLGEQVRRLLNLVRPNEIIVPLRPSKKKPATD